MANLLDLSPDEFMFTLQEFGYSPERRDELIRQYREHNSVFGALNRAAQERQDEIAGEGRRPVAGGFLSKPEGSLGMDAVRGLRVEPMAGLLGMLTGAGRAVEAPAAAARGLIPVDDIPLEALGTAGMASLGGAAMARPAGSVGMGGRVADGERSPLRVYHGTSADVDRLDPLYARTARDLYTTPIRDDAAMYGPNVLEFDVYGNIGDFRPESRSRDAVQLMRKVYSDHGMSDYFDSFDEFVSALDNGDLYQRFASSKAQDDIIAGLLDEGGFDAIRIPDAGFGGNMSESVVARNPDVFAPINNTPDPLPKIGDIDPQNDVGFFSFPFDDLSANRDQTVGLLSTAAAAEPRNAAERMARDILDMRAAGRAGEVTDEMMAQADPQYMFANTPLPMDEASRMVRAAGQGFDLMRPMYHGTDTDFASINTNMGSGERYKTGFFSSDNPDVAASYAPNRDLGRILPVMSRAADRGVVVDAQGANWNRIDAASPARDSSSVLSNEFPELAGDQNAYSYFSRMYDDLMGLRELSTNAMARERRFEGDPSITFENVIDRGPFSLTNDQAISASRPSTVAVDFYPQNIRSRFARFDPEFAHLANLNAANIDPLAGLFGALAAEEQRRQRNSQ